MPVKTTVMKMWWKRDKNSLFNPDPQSCFCLHKNNHQNQSLSLKPAWLSFLNILPFFSWLPFLSVLSHPCNFLFLMPASTTPPAHGTRSSAQKANNPSTTKQHKPKDLTPAQSKQKEAENIS